MSMQVSCPGCAKKLAVSQELLGKKIKCPGCQTVLALAAPKAQQPATPVRQSAQPGRHTRRGDHNQRQLCGGLPVRHENARDGSRPREAGSLSGL